MSYRIAYPENWWIAPQEDMTLSKGQMDWAMLKENERSPTTISVMVFSNYNMEALKAKGVKEIIIDGKKAYECSVELNMFGAVVKQKMVVLHSNNFFYVIQCSTAENLFRAAEDIFDTSIKSLEIQ